MYICMYVCVYVIKCKCVLWLHIPKDLKAVITIYHNVNFYPNIILMQ